MMRLNISMAGLGCLAAVRWPEGVQPFRAITAGWRDILLTKKTIRGYYNCAVWINFQFGFLLRNAGGTDMNLGKKHNQHGFTIHEMLLVILISTVLLSLSIVGVVSYMRSLQLAQLDNSAKEIFLAAQNRAILLRSSQQLNGLVVGEENAIKNVDVIPNSNGGIQITAYYIHCDNSHMDQLLPDGTIDPTLWDGDFWITYEPESGSVIDVFFCDQDLEVGESFPDFYKEWRAASKSDRKNRKPMGGLLRG